MASSRCTHVMFLGSSVVGRSPSRVLAMYCTQGPHAPLSAEKTTKCGPGAFCSLANRQHDTAVTLTALYFTVRQGHEELRHVCLIVHRGQA